MQQELNRRGTREDLLESLKLGETILEKQQELVLNINLLLE